MKICFIKLRNENTQNEKHFIHLKIKGVYKTMLEALKKYKHKLASDV